jgi:superfamily II DNA or RNA helicase
VFSLRPYQQAAVDQVRDSFRAGRRRPLLVAPTGSGKTVTFSYVTASAAAKGNRTLILVHRAELLEQCHRALNSMDVPHGLIAAGLTPERHQLTQIASVQTLIRRFDRVVAPDLIVIDEAHHATAGAWASVLKQYPDARVLGVTATPQRLDGKGLGEVFDDLIRGPEVADLIEQNFLARPIYYAPKTVSMDGVRTTAGDYNRADLAERMDRPTITGDAVTHYRKYCDGQPCIVFCTGIKHAEHVAAAFNAEGYRFQVIDGTLSKDERARRVLDLSSGALQGLVSVDIVSEGFDLPCVSVAILLRPTASLSLHLQQIGRVLRPSPGKQRAVILDHVGNCRRHGLAEEIRDWSLDGIKRKTKRGPQDDVASTRQCPQCFAVHTPSPACPQCLHVYEIKDRIPDVVDGELEELKARQQVRERKREQGTAQTLEDLIKVGKARGMKNPYGWAHNVFKARQRK